MLGVAAMARIPDNTRIYAIGDIHGRADLLAALLGQIEADDKARPPVATRLVFLGDYIDRGPDSYGVIELLLKGLPAGMGADFLMGNHEQMMLDALAEDWRMPLWLRNGGGAAVLSYTRAARERGENAGPWSDITGIVPAVHLAFLAGLKVLIEYGDYAFVHAGIQPGTDLHTQDPHDLVWMREPFLSYGGSFGKIIVHGHTPVEAPEIRHNRIGIDTGAVFTGRLTALVLEGDTRAFLST